MATLNITIDSNQAVTNANLIRNAIYGISNASKTAVTSLELLQTASVNAVSALASMGIASRAAFENINTGYQTFIMQMLAQNKAFEGTGAKFRSEGAKNAFAFGKQAEGMARSTEAVGAAVTKNFGVMQTMAKGARGELDKMPRAFVAIDKSATSGIGSITTFFGRLAIGVFLVGELVMIFSALSRAINGLSKITGAQEMVFQIALMKDQLLSITKDVFKHFQGDLESAFEGMNKWIAQNKDDIKNFLISTVENVKAFFNVMKDIVNFFMQHEDMLSFGIIGYAILGKGKGIALAALVMGERMIRMVMAIGEAMDLVAAKKATWGEIFEGSGGLLGGTAQLEEFLEKFELSDKSKSGKATINEEIKLATIELEKFNRELEKTQEEFRKQFEELDRKSLPFSPRPLIEGARSALQDKALAEWHKKNDASSRQAIADLRASYDVAIADIMAKRDVAAQKLNELQATKESIVPDDLSITSGKVVELQKKIFSETKIMTDDHYKYLIEQERLFHVASELLMQHTADKQNNLRAENIRHAMEEYDLISQKRASDMIVYSESFKVTKVMSEELYKSLVAGENDLHKIMLLHADTSSKRWSEEQRHQQILIGLYEKLTNSVKHYADTMKDFFGEDVNRNKVMEFLYGKDSIEKDVYLEVHYIGGESDSIKNLFQSDPSIHEPYVIQLEVELIDTDEFYKFTKEYKEIVLLDKLMQGKIDVKSFWSQFVPGMDDALSKANDEVALLIQGINDLDDAYSKYSSITGRMTIDAYNRELEKIKAQVDEMENLGVAADEVRKILERQAAIKFLEGQEDFESGFMAGLLRLKDEIEPWGKTMSDAVVEAAHDMYNAMNDFFFDALEGRMESFEEYFAGFMSELNKITASFLTENLKRGIASMLPSGMTGISSMPLLLKGQSGQPGGSGGYQMQWSDATWAAMDKSKASVGWGPYAGAGLMAAGSMYSIYQQSQGVGPNKAAGTGVMSGMLAGAGIGTIIEPGLGTAIGAAIGAIIGGVSGYLMGEQQKKAKLELATGGKIAMEYPSVKTPFGQFGFETAEEISDINQYKQTMVAVKEATISIAEMMTDTQIDAIREYFESGWDSERIKGDMDPSHIEGLFKDYFSEIGSMWGTEFGQWIAGFEGTLDDLFEGIKRHAEAIKFTRDIFDPQLMTEWDTAAKDFNSEVDLMRENLEETGGSVQELTDLEAARVKGLQDLKQTYMDDFTAMKLQLGGMDANSVGLEMFARKFGTTANTVVNNWSSIEAVIMAMDFDTFNENVAASGMTLADATAMILGFNSAADVMADALYNINLASGQAIGMFSDLDLVTMNVNVQFRSWMDTLISLERPIEEQIELQRRWDEALSQAAKNYEAGIMMLKAQLPGLSTGMQRQLTLQGLGLKYGIDPSMITGSFIKDIINQVANSNVVLTQDFLGDLTTAYNLFFSSTSSSLEVLDVSAGTASDALDALSDEARKLADEWKKVSENIAKDIERMMFTADNPQNVLERMGLVRAEIEALGMVDTPEEAERVRELYNTLLELGKEAWQRPTSEYQAVFDEVKSGLEMIGEIAKSQEVVLLQEIADNTAEMIAQQAMGRTELFGVVESFAGSVNNLAAVFSSMGTGNPMQALRPNLDEYMPATGGNSAMLDLIHGLQIYASGHGWMETNPGFVVPSFQYGGIHHGTGLAMLHGDEAVIPIHNGAVPVELVGGGETVVHITVQVTGGGDPAEIKRRAREGVLEALRTPEASAIMNRNRRWSGK